MHVELRGGFRSILSGLQGRMELVGNPYSSLIQHCVRLGHQFEIGDLDFVLNYEIEFPLLHS